MTHSPFNTSDSLHFVGIGGIGMSGLAQMCAGIGLKVSGSDRAVDNPENRRIFNALRNQGIAIFPQDGSGVKASKPDYIVYSTAIEDDNPDFIAAASIPRLHRSHALSRAMATLDSIQMIAVTGSCGKTTVSAWLAETLFRAGHSPSFLSGGLVNSFISENSAGNYHYGEGKFFVFEADESDKSLLAYQPDYSVILNVGTDHYPKEQLLDVFRQFLRQTRSAAVIEKDVAGQLGPECMSHLKVVLFDAGENGSGDFSHSNYRGGQFPVASFPRHGDITLPMPGRHNAANALAILAAFEMLGLPTDSAAAELHNFRGVWRRFNLAGQLPSGAPVYDDYAHNVEKLISCIDAAREIRKGKVFAIFQPHGFGPLKFMRDELFRALEIHLRPADAFAMLPVYYAGGTSTFSPSSSEVITGYQSEGKRNYLSFDSRQQAQAYLDSHTGADDIVLIMGARDNSLSDWATFLTCQKSI